MTTKQMAKQLAKLARKYVASHPQATYKATYGYVQNAGISVSFQGNSPDNLKLCLMTIYFNNTEYVAWRGNGFKWKRERLQEVKDAGDN